MMTLRELLLKVYRYGHFRIYQPNRDCLIFESYYKIHSEYDLCELHGEIDWAWMHDNDYFKDNDYMPAEWRSAERIDELDEQTQLLLKKYGNYGVVALETSQCGVNRIYYDENGKLQINRHFNEQGRDTEECLNIFIIPYDTEHASGCDRCHHALLESHPHADGHGRIDTYSPDVEDLECKKCPFLKRIGDDYDWDNDDADWDDFIYDEE